MDARPIAGTGRTGLHGPLPRRFTPPGTTYELKDSVHRSEATSVFMRQSKFTETQIVSILKEANTGRPVDEIWQ